MFKSNVSNSGGRAYCYHPDTSSNSLAATEKFLMEMPNNTLPDLAIERNRKRIEN